MFRAKTDRVEQLSQKYPKRIAELETLFDKRSNLYIDYANVRPWADKLKWHIDCHRLRQFFASFDTVKCLKIFHGTLEGNQDASFNRCFQYPSCFNGHLKELHTLAAAEITQGGKH
jgi:hypothetical protein